MWKAREGLRRAGLRRIWLRWAPVTFLRHGSPSPQELGLCGEELAARWIFARGFRIHARRLRLKPAEVDLWAEKRGTGWVVEVKTRRLRGAPGERGGSPWRPADSLGAQQLRRLERAATRLARRSSLPHGILLLEVCVQRGCGRFQIQPRILIAARSGLARGEWDAHAL